MKRLCLTPVMTAILLVLGLGSMTLAAPQSDRKTFNVLVDQLLSHVDKQIQDRQALIEQTEKLYDDITKTKKDSLDSNIQIARQESRLRESLIAADEMIHSKDSSVRVKDLLDYLRRSISHDQELFNQYTTQYNSVRYGYERQLAKIKEEQTLLKSIRKDLERLKAFPNDKDKARFFIASVKKLLDGLGGEEAAQ